MYIFVHLVYGTWYIYSVSECVLTFSFKIFLQILCMAYILGHFDNEKCTNVIKYPIILRLWHCLKLLRNHVFGVISKFPTISVTQIIFFQLKILNWFSSTETHQERPNRRRMRTWWVRSQQFILQSYDQHLNCIILFYFVQKMQDGVSKYFWCTQPQKALTLNSPTLFDVHTPGHEKNTFNRFLCSIVFFGQAFIELDFTNPEKRTPIKLQFTITQWMMGQNTALSFLSVLAALPIT